MAKSRSNIDPKSMDTIASLRLIAAKPGGEETPIELILCRPYPVGTGAWECRFSIVGLLEDMPPTRDADSWRALVLATNFIRMHLEVMIECGGRLSDPTSGRDIEVAEIFTKTGDERG
jgi:hypothetical protein